MDNVYYTPEKFGLTEIGQIDWSEPNWDFDMTVVWQDERGQYWMGHDSGCSCPAPFEDVTNVNELDGPYTAAGVKTHLGYEVDEAAKWPGRWYGYPEAELRKQAADLIARL